MLVAMNGGPNSWSKRLQNDILKAIADPTSALVDKIGHAKIDRALLRRLAITGGASDKENINLPRGGTSESAKNKTNKTIQNILNGLTIIMSSHEPALKPTVIKSIADNAAKLQQLSVASSASTTSTTDDSTTDANKTNKTIQNILNGLAITISSHDPALKPSVIKSIADNAAKMQHISVASSASTTSTTDASTTDASTIDVPTTDAPTPKLDEYQMREMIDPEDGGLMFCYAKTGTPTPAGTTSGSRAWKDWEGCQACKKKPCACNGKLLSVDQIKDGLGPKQRMGRNARLTKSVTTGSLAMSVARGLEN